MAILVVTHSNDNVSVADVIRRIEATGEVVIRLDTDRFPTDLRVSSAYVGGRLEMWMSDGAREVPLHEVGAVWYRRSRVGRSIPHDMDPELRGTAIHESLSALFGAISNLPAFKMDDYWTVRRASQKQLQLEAAARAGLALPATLISNDQAAVRRFVRDLPTGRAIFKPVGDIFIGRTFPVDRVWTNRLTEQELATLDGLEHCPMIFQEEIPKALDVRATIVGDDVFTAAVDPARVGADDDWRKQGEALLDQWVPFELPRDISNRLVATTRDLGLRYGAADFVLTPNDELVFLEVNPVGEFSWLDTSVPLPIAEAIAALLVRNARATPNQREDTCAA